jgi:hypothetical protein
MRKACVGGGGQGKETLRKNGNNREKEVSRLCCIVGVARFLVMKLGYFSA